MAAEEIPVGSDYVERIARKMHERRGTVPFEALSGKAREADRARVSAVLGAFSDVDLRRELTPSTSLESFREALLDRMAAAVNAARRRTTSNRARAYAELPEAAREYDRSLAVSVVRAVREASVEMRMDGATVSVVDAPDGTPSLSVRFDRAELTPAQREMQDELLDNGMGANCMAFVRSAPGADIEALAARILSSGSPEDCLEFAEWASKHPDRTGNVDLEPFRERVLSEGSPDLLVRMARDADMGGTARARIEQMVLESGDPELMETYAYEVPGADAQALMRRSVEIESGAVPLFPGKGPEV